MLYRSSTAWIKFVGLRNYYAVALCRAVDLNRSYDYYSVRAAHDDLDLLKQDMALTGEQNLIYITREELLALPEEPTFTVGE